MFSTYAQFEYVFAATQLVFMSLGMGAELSARDFLEVFRAPKGMALGILAQLLIVPLTAATFARWGSPDAGIAAGFILVAAMPGGSISNLVTFLAWGNAALSIALTACCTLGSILTIPAILRVFGGEIVPREFAMPVGSIVAEVFGYLLVPLAVGMLVARFAPVVRARFAKTCLRIGMFFFLGIVVGSLVSGRIDVAAYGASVPLSIIAFCVAIQQISMLPGRLLGFPTPDTLAVGVEATVRNVNLALLLKTTLFPVTDAASARVADGVLYVILFYGAVSVLASIPLVVVHRWRRRRFMTASSGDMPRNDL